jgi:cytosine deaminase
LTVAFGQDCVMDPWYPLGSGNMLEVAHMAIHAAHLTGYEQMRQCFLAVTENPARILGLEGYGLEPGCYADLVVLQAADAVEAIRLKPACLYVFRRGRLIAQTPPVVAQLHLPERPTQVEFSRQLWTSSAHGTAEAAGLELLQGEGQGAGYGHRDAN